MLPQQIDAVREQLSEQHWRRYDIPPHVAALLLADPRPHCRYVDGSGHGCYRIAVTDADRWPRCEQHRRTRVATAIRNFNMAVHRRAQSRALLTQAEAFFYAERAMEQQLEAWRFTRYAGRELR